MAKLLLGEEIFGDARRIKTMAENFYIVLIDNGISQNLIVMISFKIIYSGILK